MNLSIISSLLGKGNLQSQILSSLVMSGADFDSIFTAAATDDPLFIDHSSSSVLSRLATKSGDATSLFQGRNLSLNDPESAYNMMTFINNQDVYYKAQYAELSQMASSIDELQNTDKGLQSITTASGNESIKSQVQGFVDEYNQWVRQFHPDVESGGLLADTQAAKVALHELDQSVENIYNGARDGVNGLRDLGMTIDPNTKLLSLDAGKLDSMLANNKQGVVDTLQDFSTNFAKSASLLNSDGNFMPRQLANLSRVIHYVADHKTSLQTEFGTGDLAAPTGKVAQALAAYNKSYAAS